MVLLLCNDWDHLKDDSFNCLKHYCLEGGKPLVEVSSDGKVVEA